MKGLMKVCSGGLVMWNVIGMPREYVGECAGSCSVDRPQMYGLIRLSKRGLDVRQARRMVGVCEGEYMGRSLEDEPLTLMRRHSCGLPQQ